MKINARKTIAIVLTLAASYFLFAASKEPVIGPLRGTAVGNFFESIHTPNEIVFNLSVGYLVSLMFWFMVVFLPERKQHAAIKENLSKEYEAFKIDLIELLLNARGTPYDADLPKRLLDHVRFKEYFYANEREQLYAVMNGLEKNKHVLDDIALVLTMLKEEVAYAVSRMPVRNAEVHVFFRRFCIEVQRQTSGSILQSDERVKYTTSFVWALLARWDMVSGQRRDDIVQEMIDRL